MSEQTHQDELGHFLRTRRQKLSPADVGLISGVRRRATGLRREEVAVLANVSPTWYTYLEQGRKIRPSTQVVQSLAEALRLNPSERRYLHALAENAGQGYATPETPDSEVVTIISEFVQSSSTVDYPVYATDVFGDILACNEHVKDWYCDFSARDGVERNIIWWMFTSPEARVRIADWTGDARDVVARIRFHVGTSPSSRRLRDRVRALRAESAEFDQWWLEHDVVEQEDRPRSFHHPTLGHRTVRLLVMRPSADPSISVVFHLPARPDVT